ncbi:MAG TPA: FAD-binding protein, partial [Casimicrobiaceae bacterium]|nr:FAD-binding protein [Casimicrobiaceae bacterium]
MIMHEPRAFAALRGRLMRNAPLARHTTWHVGGNADLLYAPADRDDLAEFLHGIPAAMPVTMLGLGSNVLVRDGGIRGAVVLMHNPGAALAVADGLVYADAGVASPKLARFAAVHGCAEAEFLAGIPGTVGGALAMNAGCYGGETWNHVIAVETVDREGRLRHRAPAEFDVSYRHVASRVGADEWFVSGVFGFQPGEERAAMRHIKELLQKRVATQPLNQPNAGSV